MNTKFEKRFGNEFFRRIPQEVGIYWMNDSRRRLLLIGSTTNIKNKLTLIKNYLSSAQIEVPMTSLIQEINWCTYPDLESAKLGEEKLYSEFKPLYSFDASDSDNYLYLGINIKAQGTEVQLSKVFPNTSSLVYGSFRGKQQVHLFFSSLLRWLRFIESGGSAMEWPSPFNKHLMPNKMGLNFQLNSNYKEMLHHFLCGENKKLLIALAEHIEPLTESLDLFTRLWLHQDLERMSRFYHTCILKNKQILKLIQSTELILSPEWNMPIKIKMSTSKNRATSTSLIEPNNPSVFGPV